MISIKLCMRFLQGLSSNLQIMNNKPLVLWCWPLRVMMPWNNPCVTWCRPVCMMMHMWTCLFRLEQHACNCNGHDQCPICDRDMCQRGFWHTSATQEVWSQMPWIGMESMTMMMPTYMFCDVILIVSFHCVTVATQGGACTLAAEMPATSSKKTTSSLRYCSFIPFIWRDILRMFASLISSDSGSKARLICKSTKWYCSKSANGCFNQGMHGDQCTHDLHSHYMSLQQISQWLF